MLYEAELAGPTDRLELRELNIFLGKNYLVTVHSRPIRAIATAARLWHEWTDRAEQGSGLLAYLLIDGIVDDYLPLLDIISERMDNLEDSIFGEWRAEVIEDIFSIKKKLLYLRRSITPLRDVFNTMLRREQPIFPRETHVYFQDVFDHLIRVADTIDTLRDMLSSTMDAYLSVSGNRMNKIMKRLTSISTILMSVTLNRRNLWDELYLHAGIEMAFRLRLRASLDGGSRTGALFLFEEGEMDMNKPFRYLMEHRGEHKKGTRASAAQLAPLEEQNKTAAGGSVQEAGAIIVDNDSLSLSDDIAEGRRGKQIMGMEPVAIVILVFMLCFIAFIAWQISLMPAE